MFYSTDFLNPCMDLYLSNINFQKTQGPYPFETGEVRWHTFIQSIKLAFKSATCVKSEGIHYTVQYIISLLYPNSDQLIVPIHRKSWFIS